jgi:hypothetical protein
MKSETTIELEAKRISPKMIGTGVTIRVGW